MRSIALDSAGKRKGKGDTRRMLDDIHPIEDSFLSLSECIYQYPRKVKSIAIENNINYQSTFFCAACVATIGTS